MNLLSLRTIVSNESQNAVNQGIGAFASVFGYDKKILQTLLDIIYSRNSGRIGVSLQSLLRLKSESTDQNLLEFAKVASQELSSVEWQESVVRRIALQLGCPKFVISRLLAPFLNSAHQINVNDIF